jgi:hypothetical protein
MECSMPSSIDIPLGPVTDYSAHAPMAFRRQRLWFLSFVMAPFQDLDSRAIEDTTPRGSAPKRGR